MRSRYISVAAMSAFAVVAVAATAMVFIELPRAPDTRAGSRSAIGGPFTLVDDIGAPVSDASIRGKPTVIYFGYTFCPEVCPTTLTDLSHWMQMLGPDADNLNYVFVTVDPERDTPKVMHAYVSAFDPRIRGFTGTSEQIAKIAREYRVYYKRIPTSDGGYEMDHSAILYLMDPDEKFISTIAYQENDDTAVAKLRRLAALAPSS
jgi:protein SCO1